MNNELIKMVADKVGLPEDKAKTAAETVLNYVKGKLPGPVASQVDNVIGGGSSGAGGIGKTIGKAIGE
jgi:hypothetical protein